jgi:hypothetical protein
MPFPGVDVSMAAQSALSTAKILGDSFPAMTVADIPFVLTHVFYSLVMTHSRDFKAAESFALSHNNLGPASFLWNGLSGKELKLQLTNFSLSVKCSELSSSKALAPRRI